MLRRSLTAALAVCASCSGALPTGADQAGDLTVVGSLEPQSFLHGHLTDAKPELAYALTGTEGDVIAPDVWPTGSSAAQLTLVLLGPKGASGHRSALATGAVRNGGAHIAVDGFTLPRSGSYLVLVGQQAAGRGGNFTLRLWTLGSHAPRPEAAQLDLQLAADATTQAVVGAHGPAGGLAQTPWADAEVDSVLASLAAQRDGMAAFSDAEELLAALSDAQHSALATPAQLQRAQAATLRLIGSPAAFAKESARAQAFALFWLGTFGQLTFTPVDVTPGAASPVSAQVAKLVSSWPGAVEDASARQVKALVIGQTTYGFIASWAAQQRDTDGTPVFEWYSTDYFDSSGKWLGEQSQGASEPDDD